MTAKVEKWGNSLAVRIPKTIAESAGIEKGTELEFLIRDQEIILRTKKSETTLMNCFPESHLKIVMKK